MCDRRLVVLADSEISGSKQPYHAAEPMPLSRAKDFLRRCTDSTKLLAVEALRDCVFKLKNDGHDVRACGLLASSARVPDSVESILASHASIHAAEGELYRIAIAHASNVFNLPLARVREKEAGAVAASALKLKADTVKKKIAALGKSIGPPWSADQKLATLAACVALAGAKPRRRKAATV